MKDNGAVDHRTKVADLKKSRSILIVTGEFPTPSHTFVLDQVCGLIDRGFEVKVLAKRPTILTTPPPEFETYNLESLTHYVTPLEPRAANREAVTLLARLIHQNKPGFAIEFLRLWLREKVMTLTVHDKFELASYGLAISELEDPDFVLCHFGHIGDLMIRVRAALEKEWPVGSIFHGSDISTLVNKRGRAFYRRLFSQGDIFFPVSDASARRLTELGAPKEKVHLLRMGIKSGLTLGSTKFIVKDRPFTFISVGRLVEKKGHQFTLMALAQCLKVGAHVQLVIYGDGLLAGGLKSICKALGIEKHVKFRGIQPHHSVISALRDEGDAFILPCVTASTGDTESIPIPIEEAMIVGLPVISTYHGGIPEIVTNGTTGILTAEKDVDALTKAMMTLATDRRLAFEMGQKGRDRAINDLGQDVWLERLIAMI